MDTQRLIAIAVFAMSGMMLYEAWNKHNQPPVLPPASSPTTALAGDKAVPPAVPNAAAPGASSAVPTPSAISPTVAAPATQTAGLPTQGQRVVVDTDMFLAVLDTQGGDIRNLTLKQHAAHNDTTRRLMLLQEKVGNYFVAQSGLLGTGLPNHTATWRAENTSYNMTGEKLDVVFTNTDNPEVAVRKTFTFTRGSYVVDVKYDIKNTGGATLNPQAYYQFLRDANPPEGESAGNFLTSGVVTFTGPAVYTDAKKFQKVEFSAIEKGKQEHSKEATDGWIAMVQHYFVSAWLPPANAKREFFTKKVSDKLYSLGVITPLAPIAAGAAGSASMPLYLGPQEQEKLKALSPGFDLVVDYGWLTVLAYPMFVVLSAINKVVANWGWTIVAFTFLLKLVFFPLNQKAGRAQAHMKMLAPKVEALRLRHGDDKLKMNQAMMELYKSEKVNPLGGCLPILIQMPFLIAMYWVLLGAVELRNAPWIGWIKDLSTPDPFYVLPIIMGVSMIIQTKLNPAPPDPMQAKVMMMMPIIFSFMFLFFPAGLVLYWTVQNILGIAQQWYINKSTEALAQSKAPSKA